MTHAHIERRVPIEHTSEDEGRDHERLLVAEPQPQVTVEAGEAFVAPGGVDAVGRGVDEQRHFELGAGRPHFVERRVVERATEVGPDVGTDQAERGHGSSQLGGGSGGILHRELGEARQT